MNDETHLKLFDPDLETDPDLEIREYDIVASPNDFNVLSYFTFFESGSIRVPGFQRHYVWDIRKASRLIESILLGLPVPQVFLYEKARNKFLVIDGQQRLLTIYYFMKGRFPKREARGKLRRLFGEQGTLSERDFDDDTLFVKFKLSFKRDVGSPSPFAGLTYDGLGDDKESFQLRTIRNIMVKQLRPDKDNSAVFELFHRLNTGGVNLSQQEIRMSLFYGQLMRDVRLLNENADWRKILGGNPDQRQRDVEIILRMFALAENYETFKKPLSKFINSFCADNRESDKRQAIRTAVFESFCKELSSVDRGTYLEPKSRRVSVPMLEAVFVAAKADAIRADDVGLAKTVGEEFVQKVRDHGEFENYFTGKTTDVDAVLGRIKLAKTLVK